MSKFAIARPEVTVVPVLSTDLTFRCGAFTVSAVTMRRIQLKWVATQTGKNLLFQKNAQNADTTGEFPYPPENGDVHHEVEMVVALKGGGKNIAVEDALNYVYGYGGIDMTRRDLQAVAKETRRPWEPGKAFERSAPMSGLVEAAEIGHPTADAYRSVLMANCVRKVTSAR